MKIIAYLLYGNRREYQDELTYSVLSALRYLRREHSDVRVCLLSDEESARTDLPIENIRLSAAELSDWSKGRTYFHRLKPFALRKVIDHFDTPVALVDTDTIFIDDPRLIFDGIGPGRALMHALEGPLGDSPAWASILEHKEDGIEAGHHRITKDALMYNSGVVGIDPADRALIDEIIPLLDELYSATNMFNTEQFAIGHILSNRVEISLAAGVIHHYWGHERTFILGRLADLLRGPSGKSFTQLLEANSLPNVRGHPQRSKRDLLKTRIRKTIHGWDADYYFSQLAYASALRNRRRNPRVADAWATVALDSLMLSSRLTNVNPSEIETDFEDFTTTNLESHAWLQPATKAAWRRFWEKSAK